MRCITLMRRLLIDARARAANDSPDFSKLIREELIWNAPGKFKNLDPVERCDACSDKKRRAFPKKCKACKSQPYIFC